MKFNIRLVIAVSMIGLLPLAPARAACDTDEARHTTQIRYAQAMAAWQTNDPIAYEAAQEQLRSDGLKAKRAGQPKQCQFWEKAIKASHKKE